MLPIAKPVRELSGLTPGDLTQEILTSSEPLILRGLVARWPAVQAGLRSAHEGAAYLASFYRDATVVAMLGAPEIDGRFFYNDDLSGFNFQSLRVRLDHILKELVDRLAEVGPPAIYVGSTTIDTSLPGFNQANPMQLGGQDALASIWIGNATRIAAHYDLPDNLACIAAGHRRFTLFPPAQLRNLYIGPLDFTPAGQSISLVDLRAPDSARFPRFAEALEHAQVAELGPGDAILIPSMWWHHVEALDRFNVLVNYWWRQSPEYMDTPTNVLMHAILSMRELPLEQRRAWQELFRHYVFEADNNTAAHINQDAQRVLAPLDPDRARALRAQLLKKMNR